MKYAGVYKITCNGSGKIYVGSSVNLYRRWLSRHVPDLRRNKHCNKYLQAAWNKYGENSFSFDLIEACRKEELICREQFWIDRLKACDKKIGYNLASVAGSTLGIPQTQKCKTAILKTKCKTYVVRSPGGVETKITNLSKFCWQHGLTSTAMCRVAAGKARHHKEWECRHGNVSRKTWLTSIKNLPNQKPKKIIDETVRCSRCKKYKAKANFNKDCSTVSGLAAYCKKCHSRRLHLNYVKRSAKQ